MSEDREDRTWRGLRMRLRHSVIMTTDVDSDGSVTARCAGTVRFTDALAYAPPVSGRSAFSIAQLRAHVTMYA